MKQKTIRKKAFVKSLPILCSYIFLGAAYGILMQEAGYAWYISLGISMTVYTGAFQFMLITLLSGGASLLTIAVTAFLMNSRQVFYSLTFLEEFRKMGKRLPFMIHTLTDETYAVNLTLKDMKQGEKQDVMAWVALDSWCYWMVGSVIGGMAGQLLPFDTEGIDYCMTALFVTIFIDQWQQARDHRPALTGLLAASVCLLLFGSTTFMLPALLLTSGLLLFYGKSGKEEEKDAIQ